MNMSVRLRLNSIIQTHNLSAIQAAHLQAEPEPVNVKRAEKFIEAWSKSDASFVIKGGDTRGHWAKIRLGHIKGFKRLSEQEKRSLYRDYVEKLNAEIALLDGGKSYGSVPKFDDK